VHLVSVVIPSFNRAHLLPRAVRSALSQSHSGLEVVVVDDCSADATPEVLAAITDPRLRYVRHDWNRGAAAARNTGIRESRGEFVAFLDSDDEWLPGKIEAQLEAFHNSDLADLGAVTCGLQTVDEDGACTESLPRLRGRIFEEVLPYRGAQGIGSCLLVARAVLETGIGFDERLRALEDRDLFLQITRRFAVECVRRPLVRVHRSAGEAHVSRNVENLRAAHRHIFHALEPELRNRSAIRALYHLRSAKYAYRCGDISECRLHVLAAYRAEPRNLRLFPAFVAALMGSSVFSRYYRHRVQSGEGPQSLKNLVRKAADHP
jgi:O-antigen biosynthesis protein